MKQKHSKAIDMRFNWIKDRVAQQQFSVYWSPGSQISADYVSKHHALSHHKLMRKKFFINYLCHSLCALPHKTPTEHALSHVLLALQRGRVKLSRPINVA